MIVKISPGALGLYIQIGAASAWKTLSAIQAETGADIVCNAQMWDMSTGKPVYALKVGGNVLADDGAGWPGYGWNDGETALHWEPGGNMTPWDNFIGCELLVSGGNPVSDSSYGGKRGRTAIGLTASGEIVLYCAGDGTADACTVVELAQRMAKAGCVNAIMLDGGGSSQIITPMGSTSAARKVQSAFWAKEKPTQQSAPQTAYRVWLDPGHGGDDIVNGAPDGSYKEHEFTLDIGQRIRKLLQAQGVQVGMTREGNTSVSLSARAAQANSAKADLFVSLHSNAVSGGWATPSGLCVYTYAEGGARDVLANNILSEMRQSGVKIFGNALYHANYAVLRLTNMPAALIEYGFHTNRDDVALLRREDYRDKLALATAKGICKTLGFAYKDATGPTTPKDDSATKPDKTPEPKTVEKPKTTEERLSDLENRVAALEGAGGERG